MPVIIHAVSLVPALRIFKGTNYCVQELTKKKKRIIVQEMHEMDVGTVGARVRPSKIKLLVLFKFNINHI